MESQASVCDIESGLQKKDILLLFMLRASNQDTRTKILQFFVQKDPTVAALKIYADNIRSSECKLSGAVNVVRPTPRKNTQSKPKSDVKCTRCSKTGHQVETCHLKMCDYCSKMGHIKPGILLI